MFTTWFRMCCIFPKFHFSNNQFKVLLKKMLWIFINSSRSKHAADFDWSVSCFSSVWLVLDKKDMQADLKKDTHLITYVLFQRICLLKFYSRNTTKF